FYGQAPINVAVALADGKFAPHVPLSNYLKEEPNLPAGWRVARIPLADLGVSGPAHAISGGVFQAASKEAQPGVSFDEVSLQPGLWLPLPPATATVSVSIDVAADRHPISPYIYGMAFAPPDYVKHLRLGLNRWGGNDKSRYNWVHGNACNAARDWRWANRFASDKSIPPGPSSAADRFLRQNSDGGAATLLTIPTIGWVARDTDNNNTSLNLPRS